jgi:hypothetical protein
VRHMNSAVREPKTGETAVSVPYPPLTRAEEKFSIAGGFDLIRDRVPGFGGKVSDRGSQYAAKHVRLSYAGARAERRRSSRGTNPHL